jgi:hypothetical protein
VWDEDGLSKASSGVIWAGGSSLYQVNHERLKYEQFSLKVYLRFRDYLSEAAAQVDPVNE